jgi:hypothetical protein
MTAMLAAKMVKELAALATAFPCTTSGSTLGIATS